MTEDEYIYIGTSNREKHNLGYWMGAEAWPCEGSEVTDIGLYMKGTDLTLELWTMKRCLRDYKYCGSGRGF